MKKQILMGMIALFLVSVSFGQSSQVSSIKINGYNITGVSNDSTLANQNSAKLLTEAAAKKLVAGRQVDVSNYVVRPGVNWTLRTTSVAYCRSICYGNGLFVALSRYSYNSTKFLTSPDGYNWTAITSSNTNDFTSIVYGNGMFIAVAQASSNNLLKSTDGVNWTTSTMSGYPYKICYGNGLFVVYDGSNILTSPDGNTWTNRASTTSNNYNGICYGNGLFVLVGDAILTSPDGINWTARTRPNTSIYYGVCYGKGLYVGVARIGDGSNQIMTSPDGITWTARTAPNNNWWNSVVYGAGYYVAMATTGHDSNNMIATSEDGITWTKRTTTYPADGWSSICYANGIFVATPNGENNRLVISGFPIESTGR